MTQNKHEVQAPPLAMLNNEQKLGQIWIFCSFCSFEGRRMQKRKKGKITRLQNTRLSEMKMYELEIDVII